MTATAVRARSSPRPRTHVLALLGFVLLSLVIFLPADLHPTTVMIGATTADNSQHVWFLRWLPYALVTHQNPLFTTTLVEPGGVNLMWNTFIPLPALLLSPITLLAGPVVSFDIAITLGVALSGWCAYLAASRFLRRRSAALLTGAAYGFSPFIFDQSYTGHSNMVIAIVPPLMLLTLHSILVRQDSSPRRAGLLFGTLMIAQLFITEELLASEAVMIVVGVVCLAVMDAREARARSRRALQCLGWALAVFIPVAAYPVWFQFFGPQVPHRLISDTNFFVTDLLNVVLPSTAQGVEPSFARDIANHYAGNSGEWGGYVGIPMLAVVLWTAVRRWDDRLVRLSCISAAAALVLSFGSTLHVGGTNTQVPLPGAILAHLPVLDDLVPARFAIYVALFTALLFGAFVDSLPSRRQTARIVAVATVLIAATFVPPLPFPTRAAVTPAYFTGPSALPTSANVLVVPFSHDFYSTQAVLWQAQAGLSFSMPEGYIINRGPSGDAEQGPPPSLTSSTLAAIAAGGTTDAALSAETRTRILAELDSWRISEVVLGPMDHGIAMRAFLADLLGAAPTDRDGVAVWNRVPVPS